MVIPKDFLSQIETQEIFSTFKAYSNEIKSLIGGSKLVSRNGVDIFYANGRSIRMCTINPYTNSYKLLNTKKIDFPIQRLVINDSGTLLAAVGIDRVVVITLPVSILAYEPNAYNVREYEIGNTNGTIIKVLWHSLVSNDCGLVVLNDKSQIFLYDLFVSSQIPQVSIDIPFMSKFSGRKLSSISFGSKNNFAGKLTLYLAMDNSEVYIIYPFIYKEAEIAVRPEEIDILMEETSRLIEDFGTKDYFRQASDHKEESVLVLSLYSQYEYVVGLQKQARSNPQRKEIRGIYQRQTEEYLILNQVLPDSFSPSIQGPLPRQLKMVSDMIPVYSNKYFPLLAFLSNDSSGRCFVSYEAQLRPWIMKFYDDQTALGGSSDNVGTVDVISEGRYVKPEKGFGYLEVSKEDSDDNSTLHRNSKSHVVSTSASSSSQQLALTTLSIDEMPLVSNFKGPLYFTELGKNNSCFVVNLPEISILSDTTTWVEAVIRNLIMVTSKDVKIENSYSMLHKTNENSFAVCMVIDSISEAGAFAVALNDKDKNNLTIKKIRGSGNVIRGGPQHRKDDKFKMLSSNFILNKEPFQELEDETAALKKIDLKGAQNSIDSRFLGKRIDLSDAEQLQQINALSSYTINQVAHLTKVLIHLTFRIQTEINVMKTQIEHINEAEGCFDRVARNHINNKIQILVDKQSQIDSRLSLLEERLLNKLNEISYQSTLPLSDAEKKWFQELNAITLEVKDDSNDDNIYSSLKKLSNQVHYIRLISKNQSDARNKILRSVSGNRKEILRLKLWLEQEGILIDTSRKRIEELSKLKI